MDCFLVLVNNIYTMKENVRLFWHLREQLYNVHLPLKDTIKQVRMQRNLFPFLILNSPNQFFNQAQHSSL